LKIEHCRLKIGEFAKSRIQYSIYQDLRVMYQQLSKVLFNEKVAPAYYKIGLSCSDHYDMAKAGQFIMLRVAGQAGPLLRRPFSIHNLLTSDGLTEGLELLYKVVGKGTAALALLKPGDMVDILGPLGTGFLIPRRAKHIYIAGGGIGVAPLVFLVSQLRRQNVDLSHCRVFIGGRTQEDLLCGNDFAQLGVSVQFTTDDGSAGDQCLVTHPLEIAVEDRVPDMIAACGPMEMLVCVIGIAEKQGVPCQVSIETMMACGMGACLGCAVEGRDLPDRFLHACLDGPVFDAQMLKI
jgi:dihydroorotate dehydrogenase electron transfer subunit